MSEAKPLNQLIHQFLRAVGIEVKFEEHLAIVYWDQVVGQEISERTEPFKMSEGVLSVRVKDPVWRNELHFFKADIQEKLNKKIGKRIIKDIKFY
jgi:predicted nucleic acid-binding Zn ribbon protein